jgi:hypothetical protein
MAGAAPRRVTGKMQRCAAYAAKCRGRPAAGGEAIFQKLELRDPEPKINEKREGLTQFLGSPK